LARMALQGRTGEPLKTYLLDLSTLSSLELSEEELSKLTQKCTEEALEKIKSAPVFADVPEALSELRNCGYDLCVSSWRPEVSLSGDAAARGLDHYFTFILGTRGVDFYKGEPHLNFISEKLCLKPREIVFVGDGANDMRIGKAYGCFTVGRADLVDEKTLLSSGANITLKDFHSMSGVIKEHLDSS